MAPDSGDFAPEELAMLRSFFRDEANEALELLTSRLLQLGPERPENELITELMRTTHTLKGSAGTVGLHNVVEFAHALEDRFAQLRSKRIPWSRSSLDCFVETVDALRALIDDVEESSAQDILTERLHAKLRELDALASAPSAEVAPSATPALAPEAPLEPLPSGPPTPPAQPAREEELDLDRRPAVGGGVVQAVEDGAESTHSIVTGTISGSHELGLELTGPVAGRVLRVEASRIDALMDSSGQLVFDRTRIERRVQNLRGLTHELGRLRQQARRVVAEIRTADSEAERSAALAELRGFEDELARKVTQLSRSTGALLDDTESLRETGDAIQEGLTKVRMLSAGTLFQRLAPPLRTIARSAGKRIKLTLSGEDTEFDKTVAEQIADPLIQLLRNAVAHGIEPAEVREEAGKPVEGQIRIAARHESGLAVVEVSDDGAGIDPDALRRRFVESGRWTPTRADLATTEDVLHAIFDPGMSSLDEADELAGRGVGLDAVRDTISRLGGEIRMTSTPGRGTTFILRLPVTTAVSQALLFKVRGHVYAIPQVYVVEQREIDIGLGKLPESIQLRGEEVPVVSLHAALQTDILFDLHALPALVIRYVGKTFALSCDKIIGRRQIFVKDMGPLLAPLPLYAGATISGSGKVQLILDTATLVRLAYPGAEPVESRKPAANALDEAVVGRALVVDDSRAICEAMTRILGRSGYIVDVAEDGERAWDLLTDLGYDVVITDLEMPRLGGFELIERMRKHERTVSMPVIIISSRASAANRRKARELDVRGFVPKPVTRRKILDMLRKALTRA